MKAQISIEYMVFIGIMLILFTLASYATLTASKGIQDDNEVTEARRVATAISQEVGIAVEVGDGYSHTFSLPGNFLTGNNYSVNFSENRFVYVLWGNKSYSLPILTEKVYGNITQGDNTIRNVNGAILIG